MATLSTRRNNNVDAQPSGSYLNSSDYENTNISPMTQYVDIFNNMYISPVSPVLANSSNYNIHLPSSVWPAEPGAAPNTPFGDAVVSPTIPTGYMPVPFPNPLIGMSPMTSNEWQIPMDPSTYSSPDMPWWLTPQSGIGNSNNLTAPTTSLQTAISKIQDSKTIFLANTTTDPSQPDNIPGLSPDSLPQRASMCRTSTSSEATTDFNSSALQPAVTSTYDINPLQISKTPVSNTNLPISCGDSHQSPRQPESSRRTSTSNHTQQASPPLSPTAQPKVHTRNRAAAYKYRAKSRSAVVALKAAEREASRRREQLLGTLRSLQAEVFALKSEILQHSNCGDWLIQNYLSSTARSLVGGAAAWSPRSGFLVPDPTYMQPPL